MRHRLQVVAAAFGMAAGVLSAQTLPDAMSEPAAALRLEMEQLENLAPTFPDRGAVLFALALHLADAGDLQGALARLKECIPLDEGFDPSRSPQFAPLHGNPDFEVLCARARKKSPPVSNAELAMTISEKELLPEGFAFDERRHVFNLGSQHLRKIVKVAFEGWETDLFSADRYSFLPIVGIRVDPSDATIWADSSDRAGKSELLHLDAAGGLLGRHAPPGSAQHRFSDLAIQKNRDVFITDGLESRLYRFDRSSQAYVDVPAHRPFLHPRGITVAGDDHTLFVADDLGIVRIDLSSGASIDLKPSKTTLARIEGLYWHRGSLVAVQTGIGSARIIAFRLSAKQDRVGSFTILENRSDYTLSPTAGAVAGNDFYFIANSQSDSLPDGKILDSSRLEPIRIGRIALSE